MIAGLYDDMQGGICMGGIAHAGPVRLQPAMWGDGVNDYIATPISIPLNGAATFSFEIWPNEVLTRKQYVYSQLLYLLENTNRLYFNFKYWIFTPPLHEWTRLAFGWDGNLSTLQLWINGVPNNTGNTPTTDIIAHASTFWRNVANTGMIGIIRECYYINRKISDSEALALENGTPPADYVSYWKGNGNTDAAWVDQKSTNHCTVLGSPDRALVRGDGAVILNNQVL